MVVVEIISIVNLLLSLFILVFGIFSLRYVYAHRKKHGLWLLLTVLGAVLFLTQSLHLLAVAGYFSGDVLRGFMDLVFLIVLLFLVVFQYGLICTSQKEHKKKKK